MLNTRGDSRRVFLSAAGAFACPASWAAASEHKLLVPMAPGGACVIVRGQDVSGVFPEFLRIVGRRIGAQVDIPVLPRARIARMFMEGEGISMLAPATRTRARDRLAQFVPMVRASIMLTSLRQRHIELPSVAALLKDRGSIALLRGYSWGDDYDELVQQLEAQGRVQYAPDPERVVERLRNGVADYSIMPPTLFMGIVEDGPQQLGWHVEDFAATPLAGLAQPQIGFYLVRDRIPALVRERLVKALHEGLRDGTAQRLYAAYVPPEWLTEHVRIDLEALPPVAPGQK